MHARYTKTRKVETRSSQMNSCATVSLVDLRVTGSGPLKSEGRSSLNNAIAAIAATISAKMKRRARAHVMRPQTANETDIAGFIFLRLIVQWTNAVNWPVIFGKEITVYLYSNFILTILQGDRSSKSL